VRGDEFTDLLNAAQAGEEWAWADLYDDLAAPLMSYASARGASDPSDLVGEVFLQAVRDISGFQGDEGHFRSWIFTIARNRLFDDRRARARRPQLVADAIDLDASGETRAAEVEAMERLGAEQIRALIQRLTVDQQDVILLRVIADMTVEEIGRLLGKRPGAVKALQRRALGALRRNISRQGVPL
jgi:RNA polymerase sigma factor (sigma-70 family)